MKGGFTAVAKGQGNSSTVLVALRDCKVREVVRGYDRLIVKTTINGGQEECRYCGPAKLYGHGMCGPRHVLHTCTNGTKVYSALHR